MKKTLILCGLFLAGSAVSASAAGLNLNWSECVAGGILGSKNFACNVNGGVDVLYGSYVSPVPIDSMCGSEMVLDLQSFTPTLPLWWNFQSGGCRSASLSRDFNFAANSACLDHWGGNVALSGLLYTPNDPNASGNGPNTARIKMVASLATANCTGPLGTGVEANMEYYSFKLIINHAKTVGTGACAGCLDVVAVVLNEIKLVRPTRGTTDQFVRLILPQDQSCVAFQGPQNNCQGVTSSPKQSWGRIKTLYR